MALGSLSDLLVELSFVIQNTSTDRWSPNYLMDGVFVTGIAFRTFKFRASKGSLPKNVPPYLFLSLTFHIFYFLFDSTHLMSHSYISGLKMLSLLILIQNGNIYCEILKNPRESLICISFPITHSIPQVSGKGGRWEEGEGS